MDNTQLELFGMAVQTHRGLKHICLLCKARFIPLRDTHFICEECWNPCDCTEVHSII